MVEHDVGFHQGDCKTSVALGQVQQAVLIGVDLRPLELLLLLLLVEVLVLMLQAQAQEGQIYCQFAVDYC